MDDCTIETCTALDSEGQRCNLLKVTIAYKSKSYESLVDAPIFTRSSYLSILGIISFLVDEPFDVFGPSSRKMVVDDNWEISVDNSFIIEGIDCTNKLQELLSKLEDVENHEKELIFSLLDRWRKARFLEKESEDSLLYNDEATLSYFHVLELLADLSSRQIMEESRVLIEEFCLKYNESILSLSGAALESETIAKAKLLSSVLGKDISVFAKISYLLKKHNLFNDRTSYWTKSLIEARNSIAHGRRVFYDKAIFPVQPFFPLASNEMYPLEFLRIFAAKVISVHIGLALYDVEWNHVYQYLYYGEQATKSLLATGAFESPNQLSDFGTSVVFGGLNALILSKKVNITSCVDFYQFYMDSEVKRSDFIQSNIGALVLLLESTQEPELIDKITQVFISTKESDDASSIKFRDLIYDLDFHGFKTEKLEGLVSSSVLR
jgi:hypothetical protein